MRSLWAPPAGGEDEADELPWLIARETPRLRRYARSLVGDAAAADDLVQDCVERALRKRHLWRRRGSMRAWLLRMLRNVYLNGFARRRPETVLDVTGETAAAPAAAIEPPRQVMRVELREMLEALAKLPAEQRDTILLVVLEGVSYEQAAWILGVPVGTVRSRLARGRRSLYETRQGRVQPIPLRRVK